MRWDASAFYFIKHIRLNLQIGTRFEAERPHSFVVCRSQHGRSVMAQTRSIRFIAAHCSRLVSLTVEPAVTGHWTHRSRSLRTWGLLKQSYIESMISAFSEVAQTCLDLETIILASPGWNFIMTKTGMFVLRRIITVNFLSRT